MDGLPLADIKFKDFPNFTKSKIVNKEINNLFTLICNNFVASWFFQISEDKDEEFIEEVVKIIDYLIKDLSIRLSKIDFVQLILIDLPVILKQHIKDFYICKEKCNTIYSDGNTFEELFHSLQPIFALKNPQKETEYFRKVTEIILRNSLPETERKLEPLILILREIMSKIVLENTLESLAEPNFIYECITKILENSPKETEEVTTENIMTHEIINNSELEKDSNKSIEKVHPNSFKRNNLTNYNNLNTPLSFNNYNSNRMDDNISDSNSDEYESSYDDYESLSDTEYSDSIYRMIKLDYEEAEGSTKNKPFPALIKTPGAFPDLDNNDSENSDIEKEDENTEAEYSNFFDSSIRLNSNNDDIYYSKNYNTNYYGRNSAKSKQKTNKQNSTIINDNNNNTNKNKHYHQPYTMSGHRMENSYQKIFELEQDIYDRPPEHEHIIHTEPPPTFYSTLIKKLNIKTYRDMVTKSVLLVYNNVMDSVRNSYNKVNNLLDFVRKPFYLFTISSEKYNDYQLYKPLLDVVNQLFQFTPNDTWIWKKTCSVLDFVSYFEVGKYMNRSLIRGIGFLLSEEKVAWYLGQLSSALWPNGRFIESKPPPTPEETEISRKIAQLMMKESIPKSVKDLFGKGVIDDGFNRILEIFQNKAVNKHLICIVIDLVFLNIYPEHYKQLSNLEPKFIQKPLNIDVSKGILIHKGIANTQLEHELLSASSEPMPNEFLDVIEPENESKKSNSKKKVNYRSASTVDKPNTAKRLLSTSSSAPNFATATRDTENPNSNGHRRFKRVSNYIKYMLNIRPLNP